MVIEGFEIVEVLYESQRTTISRGRQLGSGLLCVIKSRIRNPLDTSGSSLENEFNISREIKSQYTSVAHEFSYDGRSEHLVYVDDQLSSLDLSIPAEGFSLEEFFTLAIEIVKSISDLHSQAIYHKDINPTNILYQSSPLVVKLIDLELATRIKKEKTGFQPPAILEGTLTHSSPEMTGRINRSVDYRTDLYSLGVVFYQLLTGHLPFSNLDAMSLVHCHIAKTPDSISHIRTDCPQELAQIVMKLLSKNAEDRYQSAVGLSADLEECQHRFKHTSDDSFIIAQNDFSINLQLRQTLYGRQCETAKLLEAFERVSSGACELMLIGGYSGVGKTALVQEVHKPMTERCGYFTMGKFDQFNRDVPYSALTQAFNKVCRYMLMEDSETLAERKTGILEAVGDDGQIIIDVIPDLELIIGPQKGVIEVGSIEAQNRFNQTFHKFIKVLCGKDHPFVLFIDDLQWVDSASLNLLKGLLLDDVEYLMVIGAYRDNEVDSSHPLLLALEEIKKLLISVNTLKIENLKSTDIGQLIEESLGCERSKADVLTRLVYQKTQGNAFFTHQFLYTLFEEDLLTIDLKSNTWEWDLEQIRAKNITTNVIELMTAKIEKLPQGTCEVLRLAACIGNNFDLAILSLIYERDIKKTLLTLQPAITEGLILFTDDYNSGGPQLKFLHDRVQQAAYVLSSEELSAEVHLRIGRLLLKSMSATSQEEQVFDIVGQFNHCLNLLDGASERELIAKLNFSAGHKAKSATAYAAATKYLNLAIDLLPEDSWSTDYKFTFELYKLCAECEFLITHVDVSLQHFKLCYDKAQTNLEKSEIYAMQLIYYMALAQTEVALQIGKEGVRLCGIDFPDDNFTIAIEQETLMLEKLLHECEIDSLLDLPEMNDDAQMMAMRILPNLAIGSYILGQTDFFRLSVLMCTRITLQYGQLDLSAYTFSWYGVLLSNEGRYKESYEFGQLALQVSERYKSCAEKSQMHNVVGTFLTHIYRPLQESIPILEEGYITGLKMGDVIPAIFCLHNTGVQKYSCGEPLSQLSEHMDRVIRPLSYLQGVTFCQIKVDLNVQRLLMLKTNPLDFCPPARHYASKITDIQGVIV
jgi:predicted ATPase